MVVSPPGASTTSSNAGTDGCARPMAQPNNTKIMASAICTVERRTLFIKLLNDYTNYSSSG